MIVILPKLNSTSNTLIATWTKRFFIPFYLYLEWRWYKGKAWNEYIIRILSHYYNSVKWRGCRKSEITKCKMFHPIIKRWMIIYIFCSCNNIAIKFIKNWNISISVNFLKSNNKLSISRKLKTSLIKIIIIIVTLLNLFAPFKM